MTGLDFLLGSGGVEAAARSAWREPAATLVRGLGLEDALGGAPSEGFELDGAASLRILVCGSLDLFHVAADTAIRRHLLAVHAGGVVFGTGMAPPHGRIVVIASHDAQFATTDMAAALAGVAGDAAATQALDHALTNWLGALAAVALPSARPQSLQIVDAAQTRELTGPSLVRGGTLWLPAAQIRHALCADGDALATANAAVPHGLWAQPAGVAPVAAMATTDWFTSADPIGDLAVFQAVAVAAAVASLDRRAHAEADRVATVAPLRRDVLGSALDRLAQVMTPGARVRALANREPLIAAAETVWAALGIAGQLSTAAQARIGAARDPVTTLAREAGLHVRKVRLDDPNWWRGDHGPLLAWRQHGDERRPCALVAPRPGAYRLVDPQVGTSEPVDAALAAQIAEEAYAFTEPFPAGELSGGAVFRFALRGARRDIAVIAGMAVLTGFLSLVVPLVTGWIVDPVIPDAELDRLRVLTGVLIVAAFATMSFSLVQSLSSLRLEGNMANRVESAVWDRLLRVPVSFFRTYTVGDLANRAQGIDQMRSLLTGSALTTLLHSVTILFSLGFMVYVAWRLAAVALVAAVIYSTVIILVGRRILSHNRETMRLTGQIQGLVLQLLNAVAKLRTAGAETSAYARWAEPYARLMRVTYAQQRLNMLLAVFKNGFHFVVVAGLIGVVAWQGGEFWAMFRTPETWAQIDATVLHKILPTAAFVSFNAAFGQFIGSVFGVTQTLVGLTNLKVLYDRVKPILDAEIEDEDGFEDPGEIAGGVEFADICFRYAPDAPPVLDGLSFSVEPGSFVAVVGPSGAGKSTLIRLLLGFDQPESGSIFYGGQDLAHLDKRLLRRQLGVVLQNGRALAGSVFDNIAAGSNVSRDDVMAAARLAGLEKDIAQLPMGFETYLGEGASTLSGGQRQRLMIARAVVNKPKLLIFDEATSALDNETQALVSDGLAALDATRLVIAHRLSTIVNADRILVLSGGRIAEQGTYAELLAKDGLFAQLAKRQIA